MEATIKAVHEEGKAVGIHNTSENTNAVMEVEETDEELNQAMDAWNLNRQIMLLIHAKKYLALMKRQECGLQRQEEQMKIDIEQLPGKLEVLQKERSNLRADEERQLQLIQIIDAEVHRLEGVMRHNDKNAAVPGASTNVVTPVKGKPMGMEDGLTVLKESSTTEGKKRQRKMKAGK